ncbi:MAG TPA: DUF502 domain-containing protein [Mariprofundaceae bacterium]|nr:DUF502 domain-containing protein [Mariprofundaceae bacterium]
MAGLVALAPLVITMMLISWLVDFANRALRWLPPQFRPDAWAGMHIPGLDVLIALVCVLAIVMLIGVLTTNFIGGHIMRWIDVLMDRIPIVRSIHSAVRQLMEAMLMGSGKAFREVVLVPFPMQGNWSIGFVTADARLPADGFAGRDMVSVFVPTTPIPTSGWLIYVSRADIRPLAMSVEEAMKLVLSGGVIAPPADDRAAKPE